MRKEVYVAGLIISVLLGVLFFANYVYFRECENQKCFNDYLKDCKRAKYVAEKEMVFGYSILGSSGSDCVVEVELLQGDVSNQDSLKIVGKTMACSIPKGVVIAPEADIDLCSGELKEGLQDLIISKLHKYIVQNLGDISSEVF